MYRVPDYYPHVSRHLSEVMGDIGLNERTVNVRRRTALLDESLRTLSFNVHGEDYTCYNFGSQSEGTTTLEMHSDVDTLFCNNYIIVIKSLDEWVQGKTNYLMIQDDTTPPGYCRLQLLRSDIPVAEEDIPDKFYEYDEQRRVLIKNNCFHACLYEYTTRNGPAQSDEEFNTDFVYAFLHRRRPGHAVAVSAHGRHLIQNALQNDCFVVATGHSSSTAEYLEWRISTSMAERFMMFSLNITQLRCYTLLKMIVKSFITPRFPNSISSFHCKTVLMHCMENTNCDLWREENLLLCVTICLQLLLQCIISNRCPHYFIPGNNLLGKIGVRTRQNLALALKHILCRNCDFILEMRIDDIGKCLLVRLSPFNLVNELFNLVQRYQTHYSIYGQLYHKHTNGCLCSVYNIVKFCSTDIHIRTKLLNMFMLYTSGSSTERSAIKLTIPSLCTTMASFLASDCIQHGRQLSNQALSFFALGMDSDVSAGRLKLASAFYCSGDMERAEMILRNVKERYNPGEVVPWCGCRSTETKTHTSRLPMRFIHDENLNHFRSCFAFGVVFTRGEINCVPPALRYDMFRCTEAEIAMRNEIVHKWMDFAVIDSLPYLYYLQYLTYGRLGRQRHQQIALDGLITVILEEPCLFHRETAINLLGHCMEQEGRLVDAFAYYRWSLIQQPTHNVARWHILNVLLKLYNNA